MGEYLVPNVTTITSRGERTVDVFSRLLADRIVYLGTAIDDGVANVLIAQLLHLEADEPDSPINLYINSPGGSVTAMLGLYDAMQYVRPAVHTTCIGQAASSAAVLLGGGERGFRSILPRGRVLLHQPSSQGGRGAIPDLVVEAKEMARVRDELDGIVAADTGRTPAQVRVDTERDLVLTAPAARKYGIVDHVLARRELASV